MAADAPSCPDSTAAATITSRGTMPCQNQQQVAGEPAAHKHLRFAESVESDGRGLEDSSESSPAGSEGNGGSAAQQEQEELLLAQQIGPQLKVLPINDQIRELQTIIRDRTTSRGDFVFSADRLIRLVVEEGLNQLPYTESTVTTPTGHSYLIEDKEKRALKESKKGIATFLLNQPGKGVSWYKYDGVRFERGNCGVSIMRSGEAMEQGLRDCCRSIRIGKILIQSDEETQRAKVYYAKFPPDVFRRKVLLMYPILSTGNTVIEAVKVLIEHGVQASFIILLSLFSTPHGAISIIQEFPEITILTTEVHPVAPTHFGQKYFGTD